MVLQITIKILLPNDPQVLFSPERRNSFSNLDLVTETSGMASIRQNLSSKGILERAINLFSNARRLCSQSNYKLAWRKWVSGVIGNKLIPLVTI